MRLLIGKRAPQAFELVWLHRYASEVFELSPTLFVALAPGEHWFEHSGGRFVTFLAKPAPQGAQPLTIPSPSAGADPEALAASTPHVTFDREGRAIALVAHPLGRGTFFHACDRELIYASTAIIDLAERQIYLRPNARTIADYFTLLRNHAVDMSQTFIEGIAQLPPGHEATWDGATLRQRSWWTPLVDKTGATLDVRDAAIAVRAALERVIVPHVGGKTGCLVSGGLDSSAVAGVALRLSPSTIRLFTYGHGLDSARERALRDVLARRFHKETETLPLSTTTIDTEALRQVNRRSNSPSGGLFSGIFASLLSAASDCGCDTVLTGEGGDEVFDPPPELLADLAFAQNWRALVNAWSFFASYSYGARPDHLLLNHALAPILAMGGSWPRKPREDAFLATVLGAQFAPAIEESRARARADLRRVLQEGWKLSTYCNYRQVLDLPVYEPARLDVSKRPLRIISPLASIEVFRAANTLRLEQQAGVWQGFRSKRVLAIAAADVLPYEVAYAPKTGIGNLLTHLVRRTSHRLSESFDLSIASRAGLDVDERWLEPNAYPTERALVWALLLNLCTWLREIEETSRERQHLPIETRPVRNL